MARGRLISKTLGSSRKYFQLGKQANGLGEFAQALFVLLITNTDDFGRMSADAFTVKHLVWPASPRSEAQFAKAVQYMHEVGLLTMYEVNGDKFLQIRDFDTHQPNLHKRTASKFPEVPGDSVLARARGIESNLSESNPEGADAPAEAVKLPRQKKAPTNDVGRFLDWWAWGYEKFRGHPYVLVRPKDPVSVAQLLPVYGMARLKQMAMFLWHDQKDDWINKTDRGIGILRSKANTLADWIAQDERTSRRPCDPAPEPEVSDAA